MLRIRDLVVVCLAFVVLLVPTRSHAAELTAIDLTALGSGRADFGGQFTNDSDFVRILFSIDGPSLLRVETTSWRAGGFDPLLDLFDAAGNQVTAFDSVLGDFADVLNDDSDPDADNRDSLIELEAGVLAAGNYTLVLTQALNFPSRPPGTTSQDGFPNFTCLEPTAESGCFTTFDGRARSNAFGGTLTITPVDQPTPTPEPGTVALLAGGLGALAARRRRRRASNG